MMPPRAPHTVVHQQGENPVASTSARTRSGIAVTAAAALLALTACSGSGGSSTGTPSGATTGPTSATSSGPTASTSTTGPASSSSAAPSSAAPTPGATVDDEEMTKRTSAAMVKAKTARGRLTLPGARQAKVDLRMVTADRTDVATTVEGAPVRMVDGRVYVRNLEDTDSWALIDDSTENPDGVDLRSSLTDLFGSDDDSDGQLPGSRTIYVGKDATGQHYRSSVALKSLLEEILTDPELTPQDRSEIRTAMSRDGKTPVTQEMWLDPQDRFLKIQIDLSPLAKAMKIPSTALDTRLEIQQYGVPVQISAPPADQVTKFDVLYGKDGASDDSES